MVGRAVTEALRERLDRGRKKKEKRLTVDEMLAIGQALGKEKQRTVIIVTSKVHTRRVKALWRHLSSADGQAIVRGRNSGSAPKCFPDSRLATNDGSASCLHGQV